MKIAYILQDFSIGGIESCLYNIARGLQGEHEFHFIATHVEHIQKKFFEVGHPVYLGQDWKKISEYLRENNIDLVQTHNLREYMLAAFEAGVPVVIERTDGLRNGAALKAKSGLDGVIASTKGTIAHISKLIDGDKIHLIYNGVDLKRFQNVKPERFHFKEDDVVIGRLSRFGRGKNLQLLVRAVIKLREKHKNVKLVMVGDNSKMPGAPDVASELKELAAPLGDSVVFTGNVESPEALILGMDIVTCVSNPMNEGIPNSLLEGMAAKKPLVSTNSDDIPEIITDGVNGYLTTPDDVDELADALEKLVLDKTLREKFGEAGYEVVKKDFNNEIQPEIYSKVYTEIYEKHQDEKTRGSIESARFFPTLLWKGARPFYNPIMAARKFKSELFGN